MLDLLGFTSVKLMRRIREWIVFHCDATYKVVKVGYTLIVFGVSDINRILIGNFMLFALCSQATNRINIT